MDMYSLENVFYLFGIIFLFIVSLKLAQPDFIGINNILKTLMKEFRLLSDAKIGGFVNLAMGFFAVVVIFILLSPSFLENVGYKGNDSQLGSAALGFAFFCFIFYMSAKYLFKFEKEYDAFKDEKPKKLVKPEKNIK